MKLGLISDTHGYFDPALPGVFFDVAHILHAGDICGNDVILKLEQIAPVTAVLGNNDYDPQYRELEVIEFAGVKFLIYHIVPLAKTHASIFESVARVKPNIVLFGHTHQRHDRTVAGVRYLNPGYSGKPRPQQQRSVAILELPDEESDQREVTIEFVDL